MSERTSAEIRRAIAARLWGDRPEREYPNWPEDTDAALALCLNIAEGRQWRVTFDYTEMPWMVHLECSYAIGGIHPEFSQPINLKLDHPEADALARLALAALEQERA